MTARTERFVKQENVRIELFVWLFACPFFELLRLLLRALRAVRVNLNERIFSPLIECVREDDAMALATCFVLLTIMGSLVSALVQILWR
ncbi:MAG: hypothetical protein IPK19_01260 [Chloroflexi bacterium]|nr:hypothetical protein [Chloroflexota bacterium]